VDSGLPSSRLELEITESVFLADSDATLEILNELGDLGVHIALDDFGTGYSSLSYLRSFRFSKIKIDRCFIADLEGDDQSALTILQMVAQLGCRLGMTVTAEGVETDKQLATVRREGCNEVQGYLFSKPLDAASIYKLLSNGVDRRTCAA
jgi:EAL domain-containing protein (putative c-di-GMP-specific phosphodiesterase class I)